MKPSRLALIFLLVFTSNLASADPVGSILKILDAITTPAETNGQTPNAPEQSPTAPPIKMADPVPESETTTKTQLIIPKDEKIKTAIDAALPNIKKILSIHSCLQDDQGLRLLNKYSMPGVKWGGPYGNNIRPPIPLMQYHNKNKCVGVRTIDHFTMPALNALQYRVVYFADDSGETQNYQFLMQQSEDGSWLLTERSFASN